MNFADRQPRPAPPHGQGIKGKGKERVCDRKGSGYPPVDIQGVSPQEATNH